MQKLEILALCNYADYSQSGAFNIIGIIDQIRPLSFPAILGRSFVAFTITGNEPLSRIPVRVSISDPSQKVVLDQKVEIEVGRNGKSNFLVQIEGLPLQVPGKYTISVESKKTELGSTTFEVFDTKKNDKQ